MDVNITPGSESAPQKNHAKASGHLNLLEGVRFHFPTFKHDHPAPMNVNKVYDEQLTVGQKVADVVATNMGSWRFIIIQSIILATWIVINTIQLFWKPFDPYPYILLNLTLSFQAAFAAPFIMISQNRQAEKDRLTAQNDYLTDCKGEEEVRHIMEHLDHQDELVLQIVQRLELQNERLAQQEKAALEITQHLEGQNERMKAQHLEMLSILSKLDPEAAQRMKDQSDQ